MKDFLNVLLEQMEEPRPARDRALYIGRLRSLAASAPPARSILNLQSLKPLIARTLNDPPDSQKMHDHSDVDVFLLDVQESGAEPRWFRLGKGSDQRRPFLRLDPLIDEVQVLETVAMGADAYALEVGAHDDASLQYLCEVGSDYGIPVILRCRSEEEVARGVFVQAETLISLEDAVATQNLLDLSIFKGRSLILQLGIDQNTKDIVQPELLKQLILHIQDHSEEPVA